MFKNKQPEVELSLPILKVINLEWSSAHGSYLYSTWKQQPPVSMLLQTWCTIPSSWVIHACTWVFIYFCGWPVLQQNQWMSNHLSHEWAWHSAFTREAMWGTNVHEACVLAKWKCSTRLSSVPCLPEQWVGIMSLEWVGENDKLMAKENSCLKVISYISCTWLSGMVNFGAYSQVQRISTSLVESLGRP